MKFRVRETEDGKVRLALSDSSGELLQHVLSRDDALVLAVELLISSTQLGRKQLIEALQQ